MTDSSTLSPLYFFSIILLLLSMAVSAILPPFMSPDENDHVKRAYFLTDGQIVLSSPENTNSGGMVDTGLLAYMNSYFSKFAQNRNYKLTKEDLAESGSIHWTGEEVFSPAPGTGFYFPALYIPQAIGLQVGKTLDLSVDHSYRLSRLFALIASIGLIIVAFRLTPPPTIVMAMLLLPMSLFQFASASLDGIAAAMSILAISLFVRIVRERNVTRNQLLALSVSILLVVTCRVHLMPMVLLPFITFIYTRRSASIWAGIAVTVVALSWTLFAMKTTVDARVVSDFKPTEIGIYYLLNPLSFLDIAYRTVSLPGELWFYFKSYVGLLGWLDVPLAIEVYSWITIILALAIFLSLSPREITRLAWAKGTLVVCALASTMVIFLAMLLTWNKHPAVLIQGVQGRYFVVPMFLLAYALPSTYGAYSRGRAVASITLLTVLAAYSSYQTLAILTEKYYLTDEPAPVVSYSMTPTDKLSSESPIELRFDNRQVGTPSPINRIYILFGTWMQQNQGTATLALKGPDGTFETSFDLASLPDNQYRVFEVPAGRYDSGIISAGTGAGISVWEVTSKSSPPTSCVAYRLVTGLTRLPKGCPPTQ